ncbi:MAG: magnesium transporter [Eubacterium sp.]|nr:magnesium transporter [Eubacterium sp.]
MDKEILKEPGYVEELLEIIRSDLSKDELLDRLDDYHDNDIAGALEQLSREERQKIYPILGMDRVAEIFVFIEDPEIYIQDFSLEDQARLISAMDSDDAVDILEEMDDSTQEKLVQMLDAEAGRDIQMIMSYDEEEIGSVMTTNYIVIHRYLTVRQAMHELIKQAGDNDNISTIYVLDGKECFYGAIDLKDLIIAREKDDLEDIISTSYPYVYDHELISNCIERIKDYEEDSIPVLSEDGTIVGIVTAQDIIEVVDDEMGDDYAKLAGLTAEEDLKETTVESMKKRLPWLIILLFLGMAVSSVVGVFEAVVAVLPIVICFQSLILDMAGNVGTQSLAVTIRVLMDENLTGKQKFGLVFKEMRVGLSNGLFLGFLAFVFIGLYIFFFKHNTMIHAFMISGCVGFSLMVAMIISSVVGTLIPMFFHQIKVDPAVASGPLITTVNDLVAVVTYYGLAWILLINVMKIV